MTRKTNPRAPMPNRRPRSPHLLLATSEAACREAFSAEEDAPGADADVALLTFTRYPGAMVDKRGWHAAGVTAAQSRGPSPHLPRPRETIDRCALRAQLRGDPMLGTAFPAARILLVEQPGPWGRGGLTDSHFDPVSGRALEQRAALAGVRVLLIRRPGRTPKGIRRRWAL